MWPHRQQHTRLPHPWDSPGKNTGVGCHFLLQGMKVKSETEVAQSCPTLRDPIDGSSPGPDVPGILQARTLEWIAISSSNAWKWKVKVKSLSRVRFLATPWTAAYQAPPSMGFSRQDYWSGVPSPSLIYSRLDIFVIITIFLDMDKQKMSTLLITIGFEPFFIFLFLLVNYISVTDSIFCLNLL